MLCRDETTGTAPVFRVSPAIDAADAGPGDLRDGGGSTTLLNDAACRIHGSQHCDISNALSRGDCGISNGENSRESQNAYVDSDWIRDQLTKAGKSQRALAAYMGIDATALNRILRGGRKLSHEEAERIKAFFAGAHGETVTKRVSQGLQTASNDGPADKLKVMGMGEGGQDGWNLWNGDIVQWIDRPDNLKGVVGAYAVYVRGTSMEPRYDDGLLVHIHPHKPVTAGCYVLVQRKPKGQGEPPAAVIKRLVRRSGSKYVLAQFNPPKEFDVPASDVVSIHRIVGSSEA